MNLKKPKRKNIKKISLPRNILWLLQKSENSFEKKQRQRKIRSLTFSFSSVIAAIMIFFLIFQLFPHNINAASYTWVQTDWLGGADTVNFPVHPTNQTNWNKYFSKDDGIATGNELSLTATTVSITQTTDADFNAGTNSNTAVSGTGADGKVQLGFDVDGGIGADGSFDLSLGGAVGGCNGTGMSWVGSTCTINTGTKSVFNFTTINIPNGTTLTFTGTNYVTLKATGTVAIDGLISADGGDGDSSSPGIGVAGGFNGANYHGSGYGPGGGQKGWGTGSSGGGSGGASNACGGMAAGGITYDTPNADGSGSGGGHYCLFSYVI